MSSPLEFNDFLIVEYLLLEIYIFPHFEHQTTFDIKLHFNHYVKASLRGKIKFFNFDLKNT